jgi:hypothetical protein
MCVQDDSPWYDTVEGQAYTWDNACGRVLPLLGTMESYDELDGPIFNTIQHLGLKHPFEGNVAPRHED